MPLKMALFVLASLLLVTTTVSLASAPVRAPVPTSAPHMIIDAKKECPGVCLGRCSLHSRPNVCNRACNTCCSACNCVPPGTAGNKELCGKCYTAWTTHNNMTKCP